MRYEKYQVDRFAKLVLALAEKRSGKIINVDRVRKAGIQKRGSKPEQHEKENSSQRRDRKTFSYFVASTLNGEVLRFISAFVVPATVRL